MANNLTFIDNELMIGLCGYDVSALKPDMWDRQTLAILCHISDKHKIMNSIRRVHKPTSHSEGSGYEIDIYTNLNYKMNERDPAMRNIRVVYCDIDTMTLEALNNRFPNSYIIKARKENRKEISYDRPQYASREISEISCTEWCTQ